MWLFNASIWTVMSDGMIKDGNKEKKQRQERYLRQVMGVERDTPRYMIREEIGRDKLKTRNKSVEIREKTERK